VTNTKPAGQRSLHVRYVQLLRPHDAYATALEEGFIQPSNRPIDELMLRLRSEYAIQGYGVDADAGTGFAKLWVFLRDAVPIEKICAMPFLPPAVAAHREYFRKHGLAGVSLFAVDFRSGTTNIYFMIGEPGHFPAARVSEMIQDLKLDMPSDSLVERCSRALTIYPTFAWDRLTIDRLCFGIPAPDADSAPVHLDPVIARYTAEAPFATARKQFIYSVTPARGGGFIKIENDYSGAMLPALELGARAVAALFATA
jgi:hypothetical protein